MKPGDTGQVVIVGAGVSGLSLALALAQRGVPSVVLEREARPGGLARSFHYDGFTFDVGPHRLYSSGANGDRLVRDVLGDAARVRTRASQLRFGGRLYPWPPRLGPALLRLPPRLALSALLDQLRAPGRSAARPASFRDQVIRSYGETLYQSFFGDYTSKFLGLAPEQIDPDWALLDAHVEGRTFWQLVRGAARRANGKDTFLYPAGGFGRFTDGLARRYEALGGELLCGCSVEALEPRGARIAAVRAGGRTLATSHLVWTGTLQPLAALLDLPAPDLRYLALVCYNLMLTGGEEPPFQWCYHGAPQVPFSRVSVPARFDPGNTPHGRRSLCVEVTCDPEDPRFRQPGRHVDAVLGGLRREGLLRTEREVLAVRTEAIPAAYPIHRLGYREELASLQARLARHENLILAGRLGRFWYNNIERSLEASAALADELVGQRESLETMT